MAVLFTAQSFAGATRDINRGLKKGYVKLKDVKANHWLKNIEAKLESYHDFSENVSYVFEDLDEIIDECNFKTHADVDVYDVVTADEGYRVEWKKAVKRKKSVAYVGYLVVPVTGPSVIWDDYTMDFETCNVVRGVYTVDRKGKDITDKIKIDLEKYYY